MGKSFSQVASVKPSKNKSESPGNQEPIMVAVSMKIMRAAPKTAIVPRFMSRVCGSSRFI